MDQLVEQAKALAYRAHGGQVDKAGRPYIQHVARVAAAVSDDPEAEAAAWLHDVLEDCPAYEDDFWELAPPINVRAAVILLTRYDTETGIYYRGIKTDRIALRVKLAEIADNANEERLALLDVDTAARLRWKYADAIKTLTGGCMTGQGCE